MSLGTTPSRRPSAGGLCLSEPLRPPHLRGRKSCGCDRREPVVHTDGTDPSPKVGAAVGTLFPFPMKACYGVGTKAMVCKIRLAIL